MGEHRLTNPMDGERAVPRVLSIAGTDPSGGAGIAADLKSIAVHGGYGMAVTTALVAQNTRGVRSIHVPPVEFLRQQLTAVSDDVTIDAVKIGMLFNESIIATVDAWLQEVRPAVVVLDPVMVASSGDRLLDERAERALRDLLDRVDLVTPNIPELAVLCGEATAPDWDVCLRQAQDLSRAHGVRVLAKGGHLADPQAPDALVDAVAGTVTRFTTPRVETRNSHGTGCSLSAAVATLRPQTNGWGDAVRLAKDWLTESLAAADRLDVGTGNGPISHFAGMWRRAGVRRETPEAVTALWWEAVADVRDAIDGLDFIHHLREGTLDAATFGWYLRQDALYLRDYARVLARASQLAPSAEEQAFWAHSAHGAIDTELDLHRRWLGSDALTETAPAPDTTGYLNHLLAIASRGEYGEIVAAALPCFWIYFDVVSELRQDMAPGHPFEEWLVTYGDDAFRGVTERAIGIVTAVAATASDDRRRRMDAAFVTSSRWEHDFFAAPCRTPWTEENPS